MAFLVNDTLKSPMTNSGCTKLKLIYPSYIFFRRDALDQPELWKCTDFVQSFAWKL